MSKEDKKESRRLKLQNSFLLKAIAKFGEILDFSKVYYIDRNTEICVHCNKHHLDFWIKPSILLDKSTKYGCPECKKDSLRQKHLALTQDEFIKRSQDKFPGKFDYSETIFIDMSTPVILICKTHGRFTQIPSVHLLSKHGCPECALQSTRMTQDEFIKRSILKYGDKFDFSKTVFVNMSTPVSIICPIHGEFIITPKVFLSKDLVYGCPECGNNSKGKWKKISEKEFIKKCEDLYGFGRFDFSNMNFIDMSTDVCIICHEKDPITGKEHGEFWVTPTRFLHNKLGCPICENKRVNKYTTSLFIEKSKEIFGDLFEYSKTDLENRRDDGKVCLTCKVHGDFWIDPLKHLNRKQGCPLCYAENRSCSNKYTTDTFIKKVKEIYGESTFDFSKTVFVSLYDEVTLICPIHGEFKRLASSILYENAGCPGCSSTSRKSKGEIYIENFLNSNNIMFNSFVKKDNIVGRLRNYVFIDFCLKYKNKEIWIEYNGRQHYEEILKYHKTHDDYLDQKRRDDNVRKYCEENNIFLIEIPYLYKNQAEINGLLEKIIINGEFDYKIKTPKRQ